MKGYLKKNKLFPTLMMYFLSILLIGLCVNFTFYNKSKAFIYERIQRESEKFNREVIDYFEQNTLHMWDISQIVLRSKEISDLNMYFDKNQMENNYVQIARVQKLISSTEILKNYIKSIFLYLPETGLVISSTSYSDVENFFSKIINYTEFEPSFINEVMNVKGYFRILPSTEMVKYPNNDARVLPVIISFGSPEALLLINIDEGNFKNEFIGKYPSDMRGYVIADENGHVFLSQLPFESDNGFINDIESVIKKDLKQEKYTYGDKSFIPYLSVSSMTRWTFISLIDSNSYSILLKQFRFFAISLILLFSMVGFVFSIMFTKKITRPIELLNNIISDEDPRASNIRFHELKSVLRKLTNMNNENFQLRERVSALKELELSMKLDRILKDKNLSKVEIELALMEERPKKLLENFAVISMEVEYTGVDDYNSGCKLKHIIFSGIEEALSDEIVMWFIESDYRMYSIIVNSPKNYDLNILYNIMTCCLKIITDSESVKIVCGIGKLYNDAVMISKSYDESLIALSRCHIKDNYDVIAYDLLDKYKVIESPVFYKELHIIRNCIISCTWLELESTVISFIDSVMNDPDMTIQEMRRSLYCIYNIEQFIEFSPEIKDSIAKNRIDIEETISKRYLIKKEKLVDIILSFYKDVVFDISNINEQNKKKDNIAEIMANIANKRYNEELYIELVASELSMSAKYLSKAFKMRYGKTFNDYLAGIRIEKAKKMLAEMDLSIADIGVVVGYNNKVTFYRIFKEMEGMAPGDYRKLFNRNICTS